MAPVLHTFDLLDPALRMGLGLALGSLIGLERQWRQRMAGLRPILVEDVLHLDLTWTRSSGRTRDRGWTVGAVWAF